MKRMRKCFVCGRLLTTRDVRFFDVVQEDGSSSPREACRVCYCKAVAHEYIMASHNAKVYRCRPRTLQRELLGRTFRHLTRNGGRDV